MKSNVKYYFFNHMLRKHEDGISYRWKPSKQMWKECPNTHLVLAFNLGRVVTRKTAQFYQAIL